MAVVLKPNLILFQSPPPQSSGPKESASAAARDVRHATDQMPVSHRSVLVFEAVPSAASDPAPTSHNIAHLEALPDDLRSDYHNLIAAVVHGDHGSCASHADKLKKGCAEHFEGGAVRQEHLVAVDRLCQLASRETGASDPATSAYDVNLSVFATPPDFWAIKHLFPAEHTHGRNEKPRANAVPSDLISGDPVMSAYDMNLPVFATTPDFWAIKQLFPAEQTHGRNENPRTNAVLSNLTSDSYGKMGDFMGEESLQMHEIEQEGGGSYIGMFIHGEYQEALGGLHNLFSGPSVIRVPQSDRGHHFTVRRAAAGPLSEDVLWTMQHDPEHMYDALKTHLDRIEIVKISEED